MNLKECKYIILDGKTPTHKFKNGIGAKTFEEVKDFDNYAVIVPDGFAVLDFDTDSDARIFQAIAEGENLKTYMIRTSRGVHAWFKASEPDQKNYIKNRLAIGIYCDRKVGGRNAYVKLKSDGEIRPVIRDAPLDDLEPLPKWLTAVSGPDQYHFKDMGEGSGRNQTLYSYILYLQSKGFKKAEIRRTIEIVNKYVFEDPLPESEIAVITRDESFKDESEIAQEKKDAEKVIFQHNIFAEELIQEHRLINLNGVIYGYSNGYYKEAKNLEKYIRIKKPNIKNQQINEVLKYIRDMKRLDPEEIRVDPFILNLKNTRLNVRTGEVLEFDPEAIEFCRIPVKYDPSAYSEDLDKMIDRVFCHDPELIALFYEIVGYITVKTLRYEKGFIFFGSGSNGKSTLLDLIKVFIGSANYSAIPIDQLTDRFSKAELLNKLANIGDDINDVSLRDNGTIKQLISGKTIQAEKKGQDPFPLTSYATQIHACNEIPRSLDHTSGFYRRFIYIPFNATFTRKDPDYDPDIFEKITTPEALSYLLNQAIAGIRRVIDHKGFTVSRATEELKKKHRIENSSVLSWIMDADRDGLKPVDYLLSKEARILYSEYSDYCKNAGIKNALTSNRFYKEIRQEFKLSEGFRKSNGKRFLQKSE